MSTDADRFREEAIAAEQEEHWDLWMARSLARLWEEAGSTVPAPFDGITEDPPPFPRLTVATPTCSLDYMTQEEAREALAGWASQRHEADNRRDPLVREAVKAGVTKHQVHLITGLARTTIDDILKTGESGR
jgi:hypothetical protein